MFSKSVALSLGLLALTGSALAQTAPPAPEPDYSLSYNIGVVSDYRYRGLSQSAGKPALQGGVDFSHKSGFYLGTWASTIRWIEDSGPGLDGPVEVDLYGGYKGKINDTFSYDVGGLQYWYPGNKLSDLTGSNANTFELYGAVSAGAATAKYSHSLTDLFGAPNSKGSGYLDLSYSFDLGQGFSLVPHVGWQRIHNVGNYRDLALTLGKDFGNGFSGSAAVISTNWDHRFGAPFTLPGSGTRDLGGTTLVVGLKKTF